MFHKKASSLSILYSMNGLKDCLKKNRVNQKQMHLLLAQSTERYILVYMQRLHSNAQPQHLALSIALPFLQTRMTTTMTMMMMMGMTSRAPMMMAGMISSSWVRDFLSVSWVSSRVALTVVQELEGVVPPKITNTKKTSSKVLAQSTAYVMVSK